MTTVVRIKLPALLGLCLEGPIRRARHWWLRRQEEHFLICADVEAKRAREAQQNVAWYQKRAAMARSQRI
jgi:hypothetical protein